MNHEQTLIDMANKYGVDAKLGRLPQHVMIDMMEALDRRADSLEKALSITISSVNTMTTALSILSREIRGKQ